MAQGLEGLLAGHTLVKRYKIEEVCGRGGFAVVYRATDTRLGRPVAVKVITLTAEDPEERELLRQRLHREARAAASLPHHPNLVTVHDVGTDPELGLDFLVMELLQGENLAQALQKGHPPLVRALRILRDAAEGLAVGHRAGLVHRDVKPGNIFLATPHGAPDPDGFRVCLLDYGIAQAIEDDQTVTRGMGNNPLSPAFASPEQLRGDRDLKPATDVFSLGVVGYQLLTGERPFTTEPGQVPTGWTVRTPIRELNPEVAPAVEDVVMRAMSVDAKDRYADADAFVDALDAALGADEVVPGLAARAHGPGIGALPLDDGIDVVPADDEDDRTMIAPAPVAAAAAPAPAPHRPVPPLRPPPHAAPRQRSKLPVVLIVALLLAAAAAWVALRGGGDDASLRSTAGSDSTAVVAPGAALDEGAAVEGEPAPPSRTGPDVDVPAAGTEDGGGEPVSGASPAAPAGGLAPPTGAQPSTGAPAPQPQPNPQPGVQQPQVTPRPQQPAARPPVQQQPSQPPAQQPQPQPQQPQPQEPRPEPPLLGQPVQPDPPPVVVPAPNPNAPRDTIRIGNPG